MKRFIHSVISYFLLFIVALLFAIPFLIIILIPQKKRFENRFVFLILHVFYVLVLKITFLPMVIFGKNNIPDEPAIIIANHQSSLDIPIVGSLLKAHPHVWLTRTDSTNFAIIRWFYGQFSILVDLSSPQASFKSLRTLLNLAKTSSDHIILFPEGARYTDGKVHEFVGGFAFLAKKTKRPVIPIYIFGVEQVYPPTHILLNYAPIHVLIGTPIQYEEDDTDETFQNKAMNWYKRQTGEY